jgi:hypothetical protein
MDEGIITSFARIDAALRRIETCKTVSLASGAQDHDLRLKYDRLCAATQEAIAQINVLIGKADQL